MAGTHLAQNLRAIRKARGLTQHTLARLCAIPRSTVAALESGSGNPTLSVLERLAGALQLTLEELLSAPRASCQFFPSGSLPIRERGGGEAVLKKLLPDPIPGMEIDRLEIRAGGRMIGVPHRPGTREYLACESGRLSLLGGRREV